MVESKYKLIINGEKVNVYLVENMSFGGEQSVIVYESPGSNGGVVLTAGRKTATITLSGRMIGTDINDVYNKKEKIELARDNGTVVTLQGIDDRRSGKYVIKNFEGNIIQGQERYITFSIELIEHRQTNIKESAANLVSSDPANRIQTEYSNRLAGSI